MILFSPLAGSETEWGDSSFAVSANLPSKATPEKLPNFKEQVLVREETVEAMGKVGRPHIDLPSLDDKSSDSGLLLRVAEGSSPRMEKKLSTVSENSPSETFPPQNSSPSVAHKLNSQLRVTHEGASFIGRMDESRVGSLEAASAIEGGRNGELHRRMSLESPQNQLNTENGVEDEVMKNSSEQTESSSENDLGRTSPEMDDPEHMMNEAVESSSAEQQVCGVETCQPTASVNSKTEDESMHMAFGGGASGPKSTYGNSFKVALGK